jgi:hypothetical protein
MPVRDGFKTIDVIIQELGFTEYKVREAIKTLGIEPTTFNADRRVKFYTADDVTRIKQWLESN